MQVNLIITGLGAATFDDVFNSFTRETGAVPEQVVSQAAYQDPGAQPELVEVPAQPVEVNRDPLDVPAFMRRRAYANISFGS